MRYLCSNVIFRKFKIREKQLSSVFIHEITFFANDSQRFCPSFREDVRFFTFAPYFYRPQTKFAKVMFLQVFVCPHRGGACMVLFGRGACVVLFGGHVWFYSGACVVLFGGCAWFYLGGHAWFYSGVCMVLFGGHVWFYLGACVVLFGGCAWFYLSGACVVLFGGMHGFIWGACMVLFGGMHGFIWGHAWFYSGGMHGFIRGVHGFIWGGGMHGFFSFFRYNEIRSMSGQYISYWNAFLLAFNSVTRKTISSPTPIQPSFI